MPPVRHSRQEEAAFLSDLLSGFDESIVVSDTSHTLPAKASPRKYQASHGLHPQAKLSGPSSTGSNPTRAADSPARSFSTKEIDMAALIDGAESWDWGDMDSDFLTPQKKHAVKVFFYVDVSGTSLNSFLKPTSSTTPAQTCTRCVVETVTETRVSRQSQKSLTVRLSLGEECTVNLCDDWAATDIRIGDTINILHTTGSVSSVSPQATTISITSKHNFLIHHPDILLTATAISSASQCRRRPLLSGLLRSSSDYTPSLVWGNMLHEAMQSCLTSGCWDTKYLDSRIDEIVMNSLSELVKINVGIDQAKREVKMRAKGLQAFSQKYISDTPKSEAILTNTRSTHDQVSLLAISHVYDIEEDIWSPTYGLKGKLDASVEGVISDSNPPFEPVITSGPFPFEIKTGRAVAGMEHRAQTMLYTLLAAERYGEDVLSGLLYYTQSEEVVRVPANRNELRALLGARNEMAGYIMRRTQQKLDFRITVEAKDEEFPDSEPFLPPTIDDERICKRCYALDSCMLYRKAVEKVVDTSSPIADTYALKTAHLTPTQASFFRKWEALLSFEEQDLLRFKKELWTMGAAEREEKGRCFSSMVMDQSYRSSPLKGDGSKDSKIHRFTYKFVRIGNEKRDGSPLLNGHMSCGDAITVSVEPHLLALARGFIVELSPYEVIVGVDHVISLATISARLEVFQSSGSHAGSLTSSSQVVFRIDKDELFGGMGRVRDNLAHLFYAEGDTKRLELVVDLKPPMFQERPLEIDPSLAPHSASLNENQKQAMAKVLSAHDYALILGMPGTGKTTVIAAIIKTLVGMGKTVLLTSYTHSAVDTILLKLKDDCDFGILRLGNVDKVHPDVYKFTLPARKPATTIDELEQQIMTPPVVATTCLSIDHTLFTRRTFDYCIVDEASQITLPTCLGPLRYADRFILVGDHFQLPPLVRNRYARRGGLDVSLFRRLSDAHPHALTDLAYQYRMNEDIMLLSNKLIYGDRLHCGSEAVARRSLVLPRRFNPETAHGWTGEASCCEDGCWMERLMSPSCKAMFVNTDDLPAHDSRVGDLVQNTTEAALVHQVAETLLGCGVREDQIGIISLYRQQVKLLSHLMQARAGIEIMTADRSQGRDKDCIIISMVRSNMACQIGDLVKDWRRINVSFTRARSKLIIFGSRTTLQAEPLLAEFFDLMDGQGWIIQLPPDADQAHVQLPACSTQQKRPADEEVDHLPGKENAVDRPLKRVRMKRPLTENGVLRGRPILQDLVNEEK